MAGAVKIFFHGLLRTKLNRSYKTIALRVVTNPGASLDKATLFVPPVSGIVQ